MGVLQDYFAADCDAHAATALHAEGGPGGAMPFSAELAAAIASGDRAAMELATRPRVRRSEHGFASLSVKGVLPDLLMPPLEHLLTGAGVDEVEARERCGLQVVDGGPDGPWIVTLTDELQAALAGASDGDLARVAVAWSQVDGKFDDGPDGQRRAAWFLAELAGLARVATAAGQRLYCWVCL